MYTRHECYSSSDVNLRFSSSGANALEITLSGTMTFCHVLLCTVLCAQERDSSPCCLRAAVADVYCWFPCFAAAAPVQFCSGLQDRLWGAVAGPVGVARGGELPGTQPVQLHCLWFGVLEAARWSVPIRSLHGTSKACSHGRRSHWL